jgi:hypothetical protein
LDFRLADARQSFLFADETVSNIIPCEAHMVQGIAMITAICRQPGDRAGDPAEADRIVCSILEREMDQQVYALSGPAPEEIKIVEDSAKQ